MSDLEIYRLCSKFDIDILEEASYILWNVWKTIHPKYSTLQACIAALTDDKGLYQALKRAHGQKSYGGVREWCMSTISPVVATKDTTVHCEIATVLYQLRPAMTQLVVGEISLPLWNATSSMDTEVANHVRSLRMPFLNGKPNVLLHDLGTFKNDKALSTRLKNIFMPHNHNFLVNTSGSGKTRLLLEGLCENWGFYFTSLVDSSLLGSSDVQNSIRSYVPDSPEFRPNLPAVGSPQYDSALSANRHQAGRIFSQVFLARLLVFDLFVDVMNQLRERDDPQVMLCKQRWLLLQLQPSLLHPRIWDVFDHLTTKLSHATNAYINTTTKTLLALVRQKCIDTAPSPTCGASTIKTPSMNQTPLFCVLDEAQYAATQHCSAFKSEDGRAHRPILREIVRTWEGQSCGHGMFMVVAGTGISKDVVDQAMSSAIMKDSKYRWCSDTGAFDDLHVQRRYLEKYLPPSLISTNSGKRLMERIGYWLHGRHRFTAGYVAELLANGFQRPHTLLNTYIEYFTEFSPTDAPEFVKAEGPGPIAISSRYKLDFSKLIKNGDMITTIHQMTTHYLIRSVLPGCLGKDETTYVEYGFARFADADTNTVAVDEPLVLLAAARWIEANYRSSYKFFAKQIHAHDPLSNGFENFVAFCLGLAFSSKRRVDEIFTFSGTAPMWAKQEAELVALHRTTLGDIEVGVVRHSEFIAPALTFGINAKSTEETTAWLEHRSHAPVCFPHASMGPDLLFVLRLADGSSVWVAIQTKYSLGKNNMLSRLLLRRAVRSVTPSMFFLDKDGNPFSPTTEPDLVDKTLLHLRALPNSRSDAGTYSLLRVVASFPAQTNLKRCIEEDPDTGGHPIASLNMKFIKQLTRNLSPVDFLDGVEKNSQTTGKRTRKVSGLRPRPTKKLKI
ncbi:hypothetical protein Hypma_010467 [Hypsizygus marmoreus]|uniref:Uncharacterized protein n=1 Tax=Hypsizygus marmoreus TaxID=39966 RepID=A0A369JRS4_HYPMA|nr:hypothetical protein Hypma_010467 [Hypsizygus marmoreus]